MASVKPVPPSNGAKKLRDGCAKHWQVCPNPSERKLGVKKSTHCHRGQADARRSEIRAEIHRGTYVADDKMTVAAWAEKYLADAGGRLRPATVGKIRDAVRGWIVPGLGTLPMAALRPDHVRDWVRGMQKTHAPSTVHARVSVVHAMFELWRSDGRPLPRGNPVPRGVVKIPPQVHPDPLTVRQVQAWRDAARDEVRAMIDVEAYYGARVSEVLGLREDDLVWTGRDMSAPLAPQLARLADLPADAYTARLAQLRFREQLGRREHNGGKSVRVPTKNRRAVRSMILPQWLARTLADHLDRWPVCDGWLFTNPRTFGGGVARNPRPWVQGSYHRVLRRAADAAGVTLAERQCSHALRHHAVSVLRDQRYSSQEIGEWIGDSALTVEAVYGRPMPGSMERMAATLDDLHQSTDRRHGLRAV